MEILREQNPRSRIYIYLFSLVISLHLSPVDTENKDNSIRFWVRIVGYYRPNASIDNLSWGYLMVLLCFMDGAVIRSGSRIVTSRSEKHIDQNSSSGSIEYNGNR